MKKLNLLSALVVILVFVSSSIFATGLRTEFRKYEIKQMEDVIVGKNVKAIWQVSYSEAETPVTVVKRKTLDGTEYLVNAKYFEVCYVATASGFGTKLGRSAWSQVPRKISKAVINQEQLRRQQIITPNKINDEKALELIANFLPELLNDDYTHLLN